MGDDKTILSLYTKKWIGGIVGTLVSFALIALLSNLQTIHTHPDSNKVQVATLTQEVEKFKERVAKESGKVQGLEAEVRALTQTVNGLKLEVRELRKEMHANFKMLSQNLIEVIRAQ